MSGALDLSTLSELREANRERMEALLAKFVYEGMTYDEAGVVWLEKWITTNLRPQIVDFTFDENGFPSIKRVKTPGGLKSSKPEHVYFLRGALCEAIPVLYGQCIAQAYGYKWSYDRDGQRAIDGGREMTISPFSKPIKFAAFGDDDSMVGFFKQCSPDSHLRRIGEYKIVEKFIEDRKIEVARTQVWHAPDGSLDMVKLFAKDGNAYVIALKSEAAQAFMEQMPTTGGVQ